MPICTMDHKIRKKITLKSDYFRQMAANHQRKTFKSVLREFQFGLAVFFHRSGLANFLLSAWCYWLLVVLWLPRIRSIYRSNRYFFFGKPNGSQICHLTHPKQRNNNYKSISILVLSEPRNIPPVGNWVKVCDGFCFVCSHLT